MTLLISSALFAHGDLSIRIEAKTEEISKTPNNFTLYFERGFLYQQHNEYENAINDYIKSESLGNDNKVMFYRKAEAYLNNEEPHDALLAIEHYLTIDSIDVKAKKLQAQILYYLKRYNDALTAYSFVMDNMLDLRPEDIIEYGDIILMVNHDNYVDALSAIDLGLQKLGEDTFSLQLKKLDYLEASNQTEKTINQFDYFIQKYNRKEFWYFKKAKYLFQMDKNTEAQIALDLALQSIEKLDAKFQNLSSVKDLKENIKSLELKIKTPKS